VSYSLRRRLLGWLLAGLVAVGLIALADTRREAILTAQGVSDRVLAGSALAIAERVTLDESGGLQVDIPYSALEMLTSTAQDQVFYRVDGPEGFITGYEGLAVVGAGAANPAFADGRFGAVDLRLATLRREVSTGGRSIPFTVTVAESTRARAELAQAILIRSAVRLVVLVVVSAGIVWVVVTVALAPLNRLGEAIAERSPDDLRPVTGPTPREVAGLVEAINGFMGRLELALQGLRNFTGNAAHQLRTPLATVRTQLAIAGRAGGLGQLAEATGKADVALARAERVLAQLLSLARLDAAEAAGEAGTSDVAAIAREVAAEQFAQAMRRGVDLGYEGPGRVMVRAEPVLLAELLTNLVDNAVRHAGAGAVVTLRVSETAGQVQVVVEDDGPGLTAEQEAAFREGKRAGRLSAAAEGTAAIHGFGLAIVREIALRLEAGVTLSRGTGGRGLVVTVALPADESRAAGGGEAAHR
jgi:two-component system sensor histidine kinase TctE